MRSVKAILERSAARAPPGHLSIAIDLRPGAWQPSPITTIHTNITHDDFAAFSRFVYRSVPRSWTPLVVLWAIIFFVALGLTVAGLVSHVISFMVGFVFSALFVPVEMALRRRKLRPAADGYVLGPRTVSLSDTGIREESNRHESSFPWKTIQGVEVTDKHVFVMVDRIAAIIIPRTAFATDEERNQFVEEVKRRVFPSKASE